MKKILVLVMLVLLATTSFAKGKKHRSDLVHVASGRCLYVEFNYQGSNSTGYVLKSPDYPQAVRIWSDGRVVEVSEAMILESREIDCPNL